MNEHTIEELHDLQALPLKYKVMLTKQRIRDWINEFGEDGVYVSFSGGKDSTVLLHLVREEYPNVPAVFCDTGLEYPEIREFVKKFENVVWLKPKLTFKQTIEKYGYPFISKEVSECVEGARRYLRQFEKTGGGTYKYRYDKLCGQGQYAKNQWGGRRPKIQETQRTCGIFQRA